MPKEIKEKKQFVEYEDLSKIKTVDGKEVKLVVGKWHKTKRVTPFNRKRI